MAQYSAQDLTGRHIGSTIHVDDPTSTVIPKESVTGKLVSVTHSRIERAVNSTAALELLVMGQKLELTLPESAVVNVHDHEEK